MKKMLSRITAAVLATSMLVTEASAALVVPDSTAPGTTVNTRMWLVQVYNMDDDDDQTNVDYGIDLSAVAGAKFTFEVDLDTPDLDGMGLFFFEGAIGGGISLSCNGGDIVQYEDPSDPFCPVSEQWNTYNWQSQAWWGCTYTDMDGNEVSTDPNTNNDDPWDDNPLSTVNLGDYTYSITADFVNPLSCETDEWEINEVSVMQIAFEEWGHDIVPLEITCCEILDADGNVLLWFDGQGNPSLENTVDDEPDPDEPDPDEPDPDEPDEPDVPDDSGTSITLLGPGVTDYTQGTVKTDIYNPYVDNGIIVNSVDFVGTNRISIRIHVSDISSAFNAWICFADDSWAFIYPYDDGEERGVASETVEINGDGYYVLNLDIFDYYDYDYDTYYEGIINGLSLLMIATDCEVSTTGTNPTITIDAIAINGTLEDTDGDSFDPFIDFSCYECEDGTLGITDYKGSATELEIPSEIGGKKVTSIGSEAFVWCSSLTSITIPDSVTSIGAWAFAGCTSLTSVTIPDSVTSIGEHAFSGCTSLTSVTIGDSVTSIGEYAFHMCESLTSVTIGDSVTSIGNNAFKGCTSLTSITIPDSVTSIGEYAFAGCTSLTSITIPDSVTSIGRNAFDGTALLNNQTSDVKYVGAWVIDCDENADMIAIKDGTKGIADEAFYYCRSLTSITIPDSVTSIGGSTFYNCTSLTSVTIPDSVTSIGGSTFYNCTSLASITIPDSVTSIGSGAFSWCSSLTSITIPDSVTSIDDYAFSGCASLTSITIPDSVTSIGDYAFSSCFSLTSITIPDSVISIGGCAFDGCTSLISVNVDSANEYYSSANGVLFDKNKATLIIYPAAKTSTNYIIPDSVTNIGDYAFCNCVSLTSVTIPDSVTSIGDWAFERCTALTSITIPESVTSIGDYTFYNCVSLTSVTIPDSVTNIGNSAFSFCTSLTSITIPDSVTSIDDSAFYCSSLTSVIIPDSVTSIGQYVFVGCSEVVISCYENSVAHQYAVDNEIEFKLISKVTAPTAVEGLSLGGRSGNALRLNWTKNDTADGYIIEMYKGGKWTRIARIAGNATTTYRVTGLAAGTAYKFRMKAYKMDGTKALYSEYTSTFAARTNPSVVTGLKIGGRASNALRLNWTKNTSADGYIIEQYKGGKWVRVARIASNATTTYRVSGLAASTQYKFRVAAYKMSGKTALYSGYTSTLAAYTSPSAVSNLKITGKAGTALRLGWSKNTSADGYIVEMYSGGKWVRVAKVTSNATVTYRKAGLKKGTTYKFRVATYNVAGGTAYYGAYVNVNGTTNK